MSRLSIFACLAFSLVASASAAETAVDSASWPQWRGPDRTGKSSETGLLQDWTAAKPKLLWMAEGFGQGFSSIAIAGGRLYTTGNQSDGQCVVCANAATGKIIWSKPITAVLPEHAREGARCTPSIDGNRVYAIASSGLIACLSAETGDVLWSKDFDKEWKGVMMSRWGFSESPLVDGDWVLCTPGGPDAMVVALNKLTGETVWKSTVPKFGNRGDDGAGYSSIVVSNAGGVKQYVQLIDRGVIGVRASDGKFLWGYSDVANGTANVATPIVSGDYVFCSTGYRTGSALLQLTKAGDGIKAEEKYFLDGNELQSHHGGMILKDGYIYRGQGHNEGFPICVEMQSGKIAWGGKERGVGKGSAAVAYADGNLIFRYQSGELALIEASPSGYNLKGTFTPQFVSRQPCWSHPVIAGGRMYLRDQEKLMCYDVKK